MAKTIGRTPVFNNSKELEKKIQEYFEDDSERPLTITGLCLYCGFESRQSFYDLEKREGFSYTIKKSRLRIENAYEKNLHDKNPTGSIFALKNLGWSDHQQITHEVTYSDISDDELLSRINKLIESKQEGGA